MDHNLFFAFVLTMSLPIPIISEVLMYSSDILVRGRPRRQSELLLSIFTLAAFLPHDL